jgi:hypothetical protein
MPFDVCARELENGAAELFGMDPQITSVGIIRMPGGYGFGVRRVRIPGVVALRRGELRTNVGVRGIATRIREMAGPIRPLIEIASMAANASIPATVPEQGRLQRLYAGAQLQNWDADARAGLLERERLVVGSLGMLLERDGGRSVVSNNHVLADQNRGRIGDRIASPGGARLKDSDVVARLDRFVPLETSPIGARPQRGTVVWNRVDAALARVAPGVGAAQGYLEQRSVPAPRGFGEPELGERVFKIGRTTGLRWGVITSVRERVGPVPYAIGECWFAGSFVIEGEDGQPFSECGDSGAVVVRPSGEVVGLLYAGNGVETYACPISEVLAALA